MPPHLLERAILVCIRSCVPRTSRKLLLLKEMLSDEVKPKDMINVHFEVKFILIAYRN